ncbi:MAG: hypothetical protein ABI597_12565, partial [Gammaproteobacteria bacterium]
MLGNLRSKKVGHHFSTLSDLANQLATEEEKKDRSFLSSLFNRYSDKDTIAKNITEIITEFQNRLNFPSLSFADENKLLKKLASLHRHLTRTVATKLQHDSTFDKEFIATFSMLHSCIRSLMHEYFTVKDINELNINYLGELAAYRETGMAYPTRFNLLKQEVLDVLNCYIKPRSHSNLNILLQAAIETLQNDNIGINSCADSHLQKFINLLKWLDLFRLMLIDQEKRILLLPVTRSIDRALGIIRPDSHRT